MSNATCPKVAAVSNGVWQGDNPINFSLPLLIIQIIMVLVITRTVSFLLKPLRQPRVVGEIIGGILLGPTALGHNKTYMAKLFPTHSINVLETIADLGLLFFLFMVGLELDLRVLRKTGGQALSIAAAGISLPFCAGVGVSVVLHNTISSTVKFAPFLVFMGVAMSITAFPVLARILAERKLLTTDVGQLAMSAAAVNDVVAWILLALAVALSGSDKSPAIAAYVLLCGLVFVVIMFLLGRPLMKFIAHQSPDHEPLKETVICITLAGVLISGFATDAVGIHSIFGAFVFGLIIPKDGTFAGIVIEKLEDFVTILMLPLYFASSGLKTNIGAIHGARSIGLLILVICVACFGKILGTFAVAKLHKLETRKAATLGVLMNTKGLVELIVLNIGKDRKVLNDEVFAIMVIMALVTTFITTPLVMAIYKPARNVVPYSQRKLEGDNRKEDLRLLSCVHGIKNVAAMINLTEATRGSRKRAVRLYILHLMELSERSSAILLVQRARRDGRPFWDSNRNGEQADTVVVAFEAYAQLSKVTVRPMTAISGFENMHEDICSTAEAKQATIIVLPYHKHLRLDGILDVGNPGYRTVNRKVLQHAPCSVGILIDRGLGGNAQIASDSLDHKAAVIFFGGADDREALAFGLRMAEHPGVRLKVIRLIANPAAEHHLVASTTSLVSGSETRRSSSSENQSGRKSISSNHYHFAHGMELEPELERQLDDAALAKLTAGLVDNGPSGKDAVRYEELEISDVQEAVLSIGKSNEFGFILVGRCRRPSPLVAGLALRNAEFTELGPVGDILTSSQVKASVLVVQQYDLLPSVTIPSFKIKESRESHVDHTSALYAISKESADFQV